MIALELARVADAAAIVRLRDNLARFQAERGEAQWTVGEATIAQVAGQVTGGEWFVLRDRGVIAATCRLLWSDDVLWPEGGEAGYIHGLMVRRCRMGQGLGDALLAWADHRIGQRRVALARRRVPRCAAGTPREVIASWHQSVFPDIPSGARPRGSRRPSGSDSLGGRGPSAAEPAAVPRAAHPVRSPGRILGHARCT